MRAEFVIASVGHSVAPAWSARAHDGTNNVSTTLIVGSTVVVQGSAPFTFVDLFDTAAANGAARWDITQILLRTDLATAGDVVSNSVRVLPGAASRPRRPFVDGIRVLPARPAVPVGDPFLNASRLETGATPAAKVDDVLRPIRVGFCMSSLPNLRAWWTLAESARDEVTGNAGTPPGGTPFAAAFTAGSTAAPEPKALQLAGAGVGVSIPFRSDLNSLGTAATTTAWVHATGGGGTAFPCIVGNDYQVGYALCVEAATRRLRFSIAGVSCFSTSTISLNRWDHVAVVYNGAVARFFINGKADAPVAFARGVIPSNAGQPLGIGADPGATGSDPSLLTFQGQISEVTIHNRVLAASEVIAIYRREPVRPVVEMRPLPNFVDRPLASLPLAGDALDRLSSVAPTAVGTVSWVTPVSGAPRTVLSIAGTGFVQISGRPDLQDVGSGLVIQAWVRPDAGLSFPTIVGNALGTSFWLGLDTTGYRPRLWINNHVHVAVTGIAAATWSHVVASYDGVNVRFYVNGVDAGVVAAPWGPIAANAAGTTCIGAESGSTAGSVQFPFKGQLADVQILRRAPQATPIERPRTLFAEFRLDGSSEDNTSEINAAAVPSASYVTGTAESATEKGATFDGTRFLAFQTATRPVIADGLAVQIWVRPDPSISGAQTLVGASSATGWWVGMEATTYKVRFERQGVGRNSTAALVANRWNHVALSYDGRTLTIFIDGRFDSEQSIPSAQGGVLAAPLGTVNVGADAGSQVGTLIRPFRGRVAGLRVWRVPMETGTARLMPYDPVALRLDLDGQAVDLSKGLSFSPQGTVNYSAGRADSDTRKSLQLTGSGYLDANNRLDIEPSSTRGTIEAVVRVDDFSGGTIIDDGGVARLEVEAGTRKIRFVLGATTFTSSTALTVGAYQRTLASFDGVNVRFYLDGNADGVFASALARATNPIGRVTVGARSASTPGSPVSAFRGFITEATIFREALTPAESQATIASMRPGAEQVVDGVDDRTWLVRAKGANIFGHGSTWGPARVVSVRDIVAPVTPNSVRATPVPIEGPVTLEATSIIRVAVRPPSPMPNLAHHMVTIRRSNPGGRVLRERYTIASASASGPTELRLVLDPRPFPSFAPANGDFARVDVDARINVGFEWPGVDRVLSPRTREFRVYKRLGNPDVLHGRIASAPVRDASRVDRFTIPTDLLLASSDLAAGRPVQVGVRIFRVVSFTTGSNASIVVDHEPRPVVPPQLGDDVVVVRPSTGTKLASPTGYPAGRAAIVPIPGAAVLRSGAIFAVANIGADPVGYADLRNRRPSLPETWMGPLYRSVLSGMSIPTAFQTTPDPDGFVPGALHTIDATNSIPIWALFPTLWHAYNPATPSLTVWFTPRGEAAERTPVTKIAHPRLYLGNRLDVELDVALPTATERSLVSTCGVSAADDRPDADVLGDPARYGLESAVGGLADIASVDRAAPARPTAPIVVAVTPADFYGLATATVSWSAVTGAVAYWLQRAADSAIYQRDLEQRRARVGPYAGVGSAPTAAELLGSDFADWCAARFPSFNAGDIFAASSHPSYAAATDVWRAWATRFYPAFDRAGTGGSQISALADRAGNGTVFSPVTSAPVVATSLEEQLPGYASNRHIYRLVALSATQAASIDPSPASQPTPRPARTPLRAPQLNRLYGADRAIKVEWVLDSNPNVRGYRLFRAESAAELDDLRLRSPTDDRLVATVNEPQLRSASDFVRLGLDNDVQTGVRVFRRDEFVAPVPTSGLRPYDYFVGGTTERDTTGMTLRFPSFGGDGARIPVPPGTAVVVMYLNCVGDEITLGAASPLPWLDEGLEGQTDYYYRVQSFDDLGNLSPASNIAFTRAFDYSPADPPEFTRCERDPTDPPNSIRVEWVAPYGSRCIVVRSTDDDTRWLPTSGWISALPRPPGATGLAAFSFTDLNAPPGVGYSYRIRVQNKSGNANRAYNVALVQP
jgi:hypothetical protein